MIQTMATPFARIVNQLGYTRYFVSPGCVRVVVPGLPYSNFDAYEHPQTWSVVNLLDSVQICVLHTSPHDQHASLLDLHHFFDKHLVPIAASKAEYHENLYNKAIIKAPLYIDTTISHVGKTTLVVDSEMRTEQKTLANLRQLQIFLDKETKKAVPIPDWWKEKYCDLVGGSRPMKFDKLERPSNQAHFSGVSIGKIPYSDTDSYFHLNFSNYLKYCINGLMKDRFGKSQQQSPLNMLLKSSFCWYKQECTLGDDLDIEYWRDEVKPDTWNVDMLRRNDTVFQCRLEFYSTPTP